MEHIASAPRTGLFNPLVAAFLRDESGASTVSWVSLAAACVAMALASTSLITDAVRDHGTGVSNTMTDYEISYDFNAETARPTQASGAPIAQISPTNPALSN